jgi:hypothetical protein
MVRRKASGWGRAKAPPYLAKRYDRRGDHFDRRPRAKF